MAEIRYLALGDSYTIGESVAESERWPMVLAADLRARGLPVEDPRIIAVTGWTTDELEAGMAGEDLAPDWQLVSLLIGVNNAYRGRSVDEFREQFEDLLQRAIVLAGGRRDRVFVLSIPDWARTPFARNSGRDLEHESRLIERYNSAKAAVTRSLDVRWFDITPSTLAMATDSQWVADDGLHPSAQLYRRWVDQIVDGVQNLLEADAP